MKLSNKKTALYLVIWLLFCSTVYYLAVRFELLAVTVVYLVLALILSVLFLAVNGGPHPLSSKNDKENGIIRINPFRLNDEKREYLAKIILILTLPLYLVFMGDYLIIFLGEFL